ncbi:acetyltransferase [Pseudomassariella vexata]|uniref:Acetyltransferase n=1 Tax=Pseudomassariella vexata TaxID=1141098 RepID=A0A1Y2E0I8_9PEZI|nr:acetyltransferase [Pseudomassariella vexata]ORY65051.1 acetyltransferase [Pseudomassariella vexata]
MAHVVPRELDLNGYGHDSIVDKINAVPGLKTSTAFFTFLRANLVVNPSAMSSNANTPMLEPSSSGMLPLPSPYPLATIDAPSNPDLDDIPPLSVGVVNEDQDKVDALNLVADSIAQQRQIASLHLVFHPYLLAILAMFIAMAFQYSWRMKRDLGVALMLHSGVIMTYLLGIRYFTGRYLQVAEDLKWDWMVAEDGEEDMVVAVRFGSAVIGALILRLEPNSILTGKKRNRASVLKGGKGVIRAWTVKLKYRGTGVGTDMLHEAVKVTRNSCGKDAEVGFAKEHANSTMVLPEIFNGHFRKGERKAAMALEGVLAGWEGSRRKR